MRCFILPPCPPGGLGSILSAMCYSLREFSVAIRLCHHSVVPTRFTGHCAASQRWCLKSGYLCIVGSACFPLVSAGQALAGLQALSAAAEDGLCAD